MSRPARTLRLSPYYTLQRTRDTDPALLARLGHAGIPGDHGLLVPARRSRHTVKLVSPDLAEFLEALAYPSDAVSEEPLAALGDTGRALLFDGILERRRDGRWVSGPTAIPLAAPQSVNREDPGIAAVLEVRRRRDLSPTALCQFLYNFGRKPFGPRWVETVGGVTIEAMTSWLGLDRAPRLHAVTSRWRRTTSSEWWTWHCPTAPSSGMGWKIYVNVAPALLPRALTQVSELLDLEGASAFKIAGNVRAALRPDKLVIYFSERDAMVAAGRTLAEGLAGLAVHPLPFTAPLGQGHRITWGMDPPRGQWMARGSWRLWLCSKIAGVVASLRDCGDESEFLGRFATRMGADGIRIDGWAPEAWLFGETPA